MNEKSKRNIILIIIAVFVIATGLISLAMYNITKSSGKKNSKDTTATMSDAGSITTEAGTTEAAKDSVKDSSTTEQATTTEEVKDSKATTETVASSGSKKDENNSNSKPSGSSNNSNSGSTSGRSNNSGNQKPNNSSSGSSNNGSSSSSSGSGSTNPSNGNSSSSNNSSSAGNSSNSNNSSSNNSQSSCSHNWVQVFIHHDQVKHTEYYTTTEIERWCDFCNGCGLNLTDTYGTSECGEARAHLEGCNASYSGKPIYKEKQVPYDVIDQEAYDEPAGYKCSICGATK